MQNDYLKAQLHRYRALGLIWPLKTFQYYAKHAGFAKLDDCTWAKQNERKRKNEAIASVDCVAQL